MSGAFVSTHLLPPLSRLCFYKCTPTKNSTRFSRQIVLSVKMLCVQYVVEMCEKRGLGVTVTSKWKVVVFTTCTWLNVNEIGRALLLNLQMEIDVTVSEDCEECCRNWNRSKRRRQVLFFDVHLSRRTPCQILDYTVDTYASESEVHLGMG